MSLAVDHVMEMLQHAELEPEHWEELARRVKAKSESFDPVGDKCPVCGEAGYTDPKECTYCEDVADASIPENDRTTRIYWIGYHYGMLMHFADGVSRDMNDVAEELSSRARTYPGWTDAELFALFRNENELDG